MDGGPPVTSPCEVVLVSVPFRRIACPSIGLGLLEATLEREGIGAEVVYLCLRLMRRIGRELYGRFTDSADSDLVGEWVFSLALFGEDAPAPGPFVDDVLAAYGPDLVREALALRESLPGWIDESARAILARSPRIVGISSSFQQHVCSLALAKRIKALAPDVFVVMGGANCEGPMGLETARSFPFLDAVVSGEADVVFPQLVRKALAGEPVGELRGVYVRSARKLLAAAESAERPTDLDALPTPDYDDYFAQLAEAFDGVPEAERPRVDLLIETSRGCWWGEKHHCTFCGLSPESMAFRAKSAGRALAELEDLVTRYGVEDVSTVDNILATRYFKDFLPALAEKKLGLRIFYELKANLRREQLVLLRQAGVISIQPGIESFSTEVLGLMNKGLGKLQGIQTLKWCEELGIEPTWLILWGFPHEPPDAYAEMAELVPLLTHLHPPSRGMPVRLERFSPNYERHEAMGFVDVRPRRAYHHTYALPAAAIARLAYYFDYAHADGRDVESYVGPLRAAIERWKAAYPRERLVYEDDGAALVVHDTRAVARARRTRLVGVDRAAFLACDAQASVEAIHRAAGVEATQDAVREALERLVAAGLVVTEAAQYLALPVRAFEAIPAIKLRRAGEAVEGATSGA